jgi:sec-independent protein translocase protein TatB
MLDVAWPELLVIGAVTLVAVGPKDLPKVMHTLGIWAGRVRRAFIAIQHDFERLSFEAEEIERKKVESEKEKEEKPNPPDAI